MKGVRLRRRLFLLAAAGIVPVAAASGIALHALAQQQRAQAERSALELARALGTAVDAELRRSISVLEALATSPVLDSGDTKAFYLRAKRVVETRPFYEVARRITQTRRGNGGRRPLLVALTGYGLAEDRQRAFAAGFDAHLVKPMDEAEFDKLLARLD